MTPAAAMPAAPTTSDYALCVRLFGPFHATVRGASIAAVRSKRGYWLLALLALRIRKPVERSWLAGVMWPDSTEEKARASLRRTHNDLRRALGSAGNTINASPRNTLTLSRDITWTDVGSFEHCTASGGPDALRRAVDVYGGPLLEGRTEDWVVADREVYEQKYLGALSQLAELAMARRDHSGTADLLRHVVAVDPLRECDQRLVMRALADCGDYSAAFQVYRDLRALLRTQLNTEPDQETQNAFDEIRASSRLSRPLTVRGTDPGLSSLGPARTTTLPHPVTNLVGRQSELYGVIRRIRSGRSTTLTGPVGVGKTRLAIEVAHRIADEFADGVCFVELDPLAEHDRVDHWLAAPFGVRGSGEEPVTDVLARYIAGQHVLVVLDNCEHVRDACAGIATRLLRQCASHRILATRRQSLGIPGEVDVRVDPLALPAADMGALYGGPDAESRRGIAEADAVRLFVERALAARTGLAITDRNARTVASICRRLDGIPLAIELAAAQAKHMTLDDIEARLHKSLQTLESSARTAEPRQKTMQATIAWSCDLLDTDEMALLRRLSVFPGEFGMQAVEQLVSDAAPPTERLEALVRSLVDKSLVTLTSADGMSSYRLLETTRDYVWSSVRGSPEEVLVRDLHAQYVLRVVEQAMVIFSHGDDRGALNRLDAVRNDLRYALERIVDARSSPALAERFVRAAEVVTVYWDARGEAAEGLEWTSRLIGRLPRGSALDANGLMRRTHLAFCCPDSAEVAHASAEEARAIFVAVGDLLGQARATAMIGCALVHGRQAADAVEVLRMAAEQYRCLKDDRGQASAISHLGVAYYAIGDLAESLRCHEASLATWRRLGQERQTMWSLANVADVVLAQSDVQQASGLYREALDGFVALNDINGVAETLRGVAEVCVTRGDVASARTAAVLFGAVSKLRHRIGPIVWIYAEGNRAAIERATNAVGRHEYDAAYAEGRSMVTDEVIALAGREVALPGRGPSAPAHAGSMRKNRTRSDGGSAESP